MEAVDLGAETQLYRRPLISYVYRLTGSMEDARDITQETFLRLISCQDQDIANLKAWMFKVATNLAMDLLRSAKRMRESYIGPWLPEPYFEETLDIHDELELDESLSFALLILMEKLSPKERIVYLLHGIFEFQHTEIADILNISSQNSRQLTSRAMKKLGSDQKKYSPSKDEYSMLTNSFMKALQYGHFEDLKNLLAEDVQLITDGGGKIIASRRILDRGNIFIANFLVKVVSSLFQQQLEGIELKIFWLNGSPNLLQINSVQVINLFEFEIINGKIKSLYILRNPDKLKEINNVIFDRKALTNLKSSL